MTYLANNTSEILYFSTYDMNLESIITGNVKVEKYPELIDQFQFHSPVYKGRTGVESYLAAKE